MGLGNRTLALESVPRRSMSDFPRMATRKLTALGRANRLWTKRARQRIAHVFARNNSKRLLFVAGIQRSGTNMVMDMLERSRATEVFHERDARAFENYELRDRATVQRLVDESPARFVVFKALCECQDIRDLLNAFPRSQSLWVYRNYEDVVSSHVRKWSGMPNSIAEIAGSDTATAGWRGRGMSASTRAFVKRCQHPDLSNASACALFWYFRNVLFFEQDLDADPRVKLIQYEQLATRPRDSAIALFDFVELPAERSAYGFVASRSVGDRRETLDIDPVIREACEALQTRLQAALGAPDARSVSR